MNPVKKRYGLFFGFAALFLAAVFSTTACNTDGDESVPDKVVTPTVSLVTGAVELGTKITLATATEGASIYYTLDSSTPTADSTPYSSPVTITTLPFTLKAIAVKSGMTNSDVLTANYTLDAKTAAPTAALVNYSTYFVVTLTTATEGASIYYTLDGSTPTAASTEYSSPVTINPPRTLKAIAIKSGMTNSDVLIEEYTYPVNNFNLTSFVTAPSAGNTPNTTAINATQYTGTIAWQTSAGEAFTEPFVINTVYKAVVTLTAKDGYSFNGVSANAFSYTGAASVTNAANSGVVTITFPAVGQNTLLWSGNWTQNSANSYTSNIIGHSASTWETLTISSTTGCSVSVTLTASSESGYDYGYASYLDGSQSTSSYRIRISGIQSQTYTYTVPAGTHTIYFGYVKDGSNVSGSDNVTVSVTVL